MIWLAWLGFMQLEITLHWFIIEIICFDLTPDKKLVSLSKLLVVAFRFAAWYHLYKWLGEEGRVEFIFWTAGCFFSHLLIFPIQLNLMSGKKAHYLGKGFVDKMLALFPLFIFRVWTLLVLTLAGISGYYQSYYFYK